MASKNIANPQKSKTPKITTKEQEQCSVIAMYYCVTLGASMIPYKERENGNGKRETPAGKLKKGVMTKLDIKLAKKYKKKTIEEVPIGWYETFLDQSKEISKYIGSRVGQKNGGWKYGWFDAKDKSWARGYIPTSEVTNVFSRIWDIFPKDAKDLFAGKKDSWNTADVYMVRGQHEARIEKWVAKLKKSFIDECCSDRGVFVGTLNTYLTKLVRAKILLPISLKQKTSGTTMALKETNMHKWGESGEIDVVSGEFTKDPWMHSDVVIREGNLDFGGGPKKSDGGNSFQYFAKFRIGDYETRYLIEQRLAGLKTKAEIKDIKLTNKGTEKRASAQTGQVPQPEFEELVHKYSGERYDDKVPDTNTKLNNLSYWVAKIKALDKVTNLSLGKFSVKYNGYEETYGKDIKGWLTKVFEIDEDIRTNPNLPELDKKYGGEVKSFPQKVRLKLKQYRFLKAIVRSKKDLPILLAHLYYLAAKQNIEDGDLKGPFLKIS